MEPFEGMGCYLVCEGCQIGKWELPYSYTVVMTLPCNIVRCNELCRKENPGAHQIIFHNECCTEDCMQASWKGLKYHFNQAEIEYGKGGTVDMIDLEGKSIFAAGQLRPISELCVSRNEAIKGRV